MQPSARPLRACLGVRRAPSPAGHAPPPRRCRWSGWSGWSGWSDDPPQASRTQVVTRVVDDTLATVYADPPGDPDRPAGEDPGDPSTTEPQHDDRAAAVVELGLEGRHAAARTQRHGAQRPLHGDLLAVGC